MLDFLINKEIWDTVGFAITIGNALQNFEIPKTSQLNNLNFLGYIYYKDLGPTSSLKIPEITLIN